MDFVISVFCTYTLFTIHYLLLYLLYIIYYIYCRRLLGIITKKDILRHVAYIENQRGVVHLSAVDIN